MSWEKLTFNLSYLWDAISIRESFHYENHAIDKVPPPSLSDWLIQSNTGTCLVGKPSLSASTKPPGREWQCQELLVSMYLIMLCFVLWWTVHVKSLDMTFHLSPSIYFFNEFALRCETETCLQAQWASLRWGEVLAKSHSLGTYIEYIIFYQMAPSKYTWHMSRVHKHVLMLVNILV